jgi:hypothetical protein
MLVLVQGPSRASAESRLSRGTVEGMMVEPPTPDQVRIHARRQLGRVLTLLAFLDITVVVLVVVLAIAWSRLHFPTPYLLTLVLVGIGAILAARVWMGVRLKRRSGNL